MQQPSSTNLPYLQKFLALIDQIAVQTGRSVPQIVDIEELRQLSPGTFGRAWADHLDENNLEPFTIGSRRKQLHDGIHVFTGYKTDPIGEAELQAFVMGAKFNPIHMLILTGLLKPISRQTYHQNWQSKLLTFKLLWQAYQLGHNSCFDPDTWQPEYLWNLPIAEVRKIFGIDRISKR